MNTIAYTRPTPVTVALRIGGAIVIGLSALFAVWVAVRPASAQSTLCLTSREMRTSLENKYQEKPIGIGLIDESQIIEVFAQRDGTTWSVVVTTAKGQSCILAAGQNWMQARSPLSGPSS